MLLCHISFLQKLQVKIFQSAFFFHIHAIFSYNVTSSEGKHTHTQNGSFKHTPHMLRVNYNNYGTQYNIMV